MKQYFSHDYNARNDRKIAALVREYKSSGYGIFWSTCEMMHEEGDRLEYDDITFEAIADDLNEKPDFIKEVLDKCISKFKLFIKENNVLSSNRVKKNLNEREVKKNIKAESGRLGGIKSGESRRSENKSKQNEAPLQANEAPNEAPLEANEQTERNRKEQKGNKVKEREFLNPLHEIYKKSWEDYSKILNGQSKNLTEKGFLLWKEFVDFIYSNDFTDLFSAKFVSPADFDKLFTEGFKKEKWLSVLKKILSTGVRPEHNLFFRIPEFMKYDGKDKSVDEKIRNKNMNALI